MRELIWLLIALLFAYAVFQLIRALRIKPKKPGIEHGKVDTGAIAHVATTDDEDEDEGEGEDEDDSMVPAPPPVADVPASGSPTSVPAEAGGDAFQLTLEVQQLRNELVRLQADFIAQRDQIARLEEALTQLGEQLDSAVASQGVSPEYNEALVFARRGLAVDTIAERCGISVAEAELVRSLAQGGTTDREGT